MSYTLPLRTDRRCPSVSRGARAPPRGGEGGGAPPGQRARNILRNLLALNYTVTTATPVVLKGTDDDDDPRGRWGGRERGDARERGASRMHEAPAGRPLFEREATISQSVGECSSAFFPFWGGSGFKFTTGNEVIVFVCAGHVLPAPQ